MLVVGLQRHEVLMMGMAQRTAVAALASLYSDYFSNGLVS
jgi:arginine deiminase